MARRKASLSPEDIDRLRTGLQGLLDLLPITLRPTSFANDQSFGRPVVSTPVQATVEPKRFINAQTFHTTLVRFSSLLEPAAFVNAQSFGTPVASATVTASSFANTQSFNAHTISESAVAELALERSATHKESPPHNSDWGNETVAIDKATGNDRKLVVVVCAKRGAGQDTQRPDTAPTFNTIAGTLATASEIGPSGNGWGWQGVYYWDDGDLPGSSGSYTLTGPEWVTEAYIGFYAAFVFNNAEQGDLTADTAVVDPGTSVGTTLTADKDGAYILDSLMGCGPNCGTELTGASPDDGQTKIVDTTSQLDGWVIVGIGQLGSLLAGDRSSGWSWTDSTHASYSAVMVEGVTSGGDGGGGGGGEADADVTVTPSDADTLIAASSAGEIIEFTGGTYNINTITPKDNQTFRGKSGETVVLHGQGQNKRAFDGGGAGVTIKRLTIRQYWNGAVGAHLNAVGGDPSGPPQVATIEPDVGEGEGNAQNWTIEDCTFLENYGGGIRIGSGFQIKSCHFESHGMTAIASRGGDGDGGDTEGVVVEDCTITDMCRWQMTPTIESGGIKLVGGVGAGGQRPTHYTVRNCRIWNNFGPGVWFDWNVMQYEVTGCSIYQNKYSGIVAEAAADGDIHHNQIGENAINGHTFPSFDCEFSFQNTKLTKFRKNHVVIDGATNVHWLGQQNRSGDSPQGGAHIGHFVATQNEIDDNTYVFKTSANWAFIHDTHGCNNDNISCTGESCSAHYFNLNPSNYPGNLQDAGQANAYCFVPNPGASQGNTGTGNTYRMESGSTSPYSFMSGTLVSEAGATSGFVPDWTVLPTWTDPPGGA